MAARPRGRAKTTPAKSDGEAGQADASSVCPTPVFHFLEANPTELELLFIENAALEDGEPFLRLRRRFRAWEELGIGPTLSKIILDGVNVIWRRAPPPTSRRHHGDVSGELTKLVAAKAARVLSEQECANTRSWSPVFVVPKNSGGLRLIADVRSVNKCGTVPRFRTDSLATAMAAAAHASWGTVVDLKDFFWNLALTPAAGRWFRYHDGKTGYQATCLPFGWSGSPYWTQRLSRPVVKWLRQQGVLLTWYVDDILLLGDSYRPALLFPFASGN